VQILFKTRYEDDIRFLAKTGEKVRVGLVVLFLVAAPLFLQNYYLSELGLLLVYAIAGIGLMILTGHTGQVSFGHAAFLGIGAYCHSILMSHGVPFSISVVLTVALSGLVGMAIGRSASKMHGFYLAIATLAFLILVETMLGEWETVTGGHAGLKVPALKLFGMPLKAVWQLYYLDLFFVLVVVLGASNLFRTATGRSFLGDYRIGRRASGSPSELSVARGIWCSGIAEAHADDRCWRSWQHSRRDLWCDSYFAAACFNQFSQRRVAACNWTASGPRALAVRFDYCPFYRVRTAGDIRALDETSIFLRDLSVLPKVLFRSAEELP